MITFPPAKINLGLYVVRRRPDGYHDIVSCFYPVPLVDALEAVPAEQMQLQCVNADIPAPHNVVWRVVEALRRRFDVRPYAWWLAKGIPSEAGLGGGSSDAAYALRMITQMEGLSWTIEEQIQLLASITADGPFFLQDRPALVEGLGDRITPLDVSLAGWYLTLVKLPVGISTAEAYSRIRPRPFDAECLRAVLQLPVEEWRGRLVNQFETPAFELYPELKELKTALYEAGAAYAAMSGSGTAFYALSEGPLRLPERWGQWKWWEGTLPSIP